MAINIVPASTTLTGMWGELAAVLALRRLGYTVGWEGGMTRGGDLRATSPRGTKVWIQVKTTTAEDGRIHWRKAGKDAITWGEKALGNNEVPVYVFVHFKDLAVACVDDERRVLTVEMPQNYEVRATTPKAFASEVDRIRLDYGTQTRVRAGNGKAVGDLLSADDVAYPVCAGDFELIEDFVEALV